MNNIFTRISRLLIIILALPLLACRQEAPPTASPNASRYDLRGKVVSFDKARREVTIAHEAIPGYMEAMTRPFTLNEEWVFDVLTPGAQIQATLVVDGAKSWIETPTVTQMADTPESAGATPGPEPEPGVELPDFTLVNQDGEKISLQQFRGQYLVLTFIYTRCPLPDYCPLMTRNFGEIGQSILRESRKTRLLSVTIDPDYDTPPVLKDYGKRYLPEGLSFRQWSYGTGSDEEIRKITGFFGLSYWQENNQIIHGLRTVVISPQGRIVRIFRGNDWRPDEVVALLKASQ
ncbi:MAG: SCO family protein [Acidobacteriota bacterium]